MNDKPWHTIKKRGERQVIVSLFGAPHTLSRMVASGACSGKKSARRWRVGGTAAMRISGDVNEMMDRIGADPEAAKKIQISPGALSRVLDQGDAPRLLDVRSPEEQRIVKLEGGAFLTADLTGEIVETWPRDTKIVTYCHHGLRSLDAALFLVEQGFTNVHSLTGGIDAWAAQIDPALPRY